MFIFELEQLLIQHFGTDVYKNIVTATLTGLLV
jgi:hypothetical protein